MQLKKTDNLFFNEKLLSDYLNSECHDQLCTSVIFNLHSLELKPI